MMSTQRKGILASRWKAKQSLEDPLTPDHTVLVAARSPGHLWYVSPYINLLMPI